MVLPINLWGWSTGAASRAPSRSIRRADLRPVDGATPYRIANGETTVTTSRDESQCTGLADNSDCTLDAEICTDTDPQTRVVDGIAVTQPCWEWQRSYTCIAREAATDCSDIESTGGCRFVREECLTDEEPCETWERIYDCPLPGTSLPIPPSSSATATSIASMARARRSSAPANDEFKDAVTALHAMDEARGAVRSRDADAVPRHAQHLLVQGLRRAQLLQGQRVSAHPRASACWSRSAATARKCCSTNAMRRGCAPMWGPIARTSSSASA